jgi:hypothetical protein
MRERLANEAPVLTPPPKLEDVVRATRTVLVPPPQVRFAEPAVNPMQMIANEWLDEVGGERFEAIDTDGSIQPEEDSNDG